MQRVQTLRSSITGQRPVAGTRQPGELYVNWADAAFGTIDVTQTAMDLVAVRFFSTLANYSVGSHVIYNGTLYKSLVSITAGAFNPAQWGGIVVGGVAEAPLDGQLYGRKSAGWVVVPGGSSGIPEAPNDGQQYGRQSLGWTVVATGGGIPDAPNDGTAYARKSAAWSHLTHGDITDWAATLGGYLPLAGGTMSGQINTVTPTAGSNAANKAYVDAAVAGGGSGGGGANLVDNGDMSVQQRPNSTLAVTSGGHILLDRWAAYATASRYTIGQNYNGLPAPPGFATFLGAQCTSATAPGSTDYFGFQQAIEGATLNGFNWGGASAQPVALSFWACSSLTGTFSGALNNGANNRTYVFTYSLPVANTPTKISLAIPGDTAGTWNNVGPNAELFLVFDLGSGTSNRTATVGSWIGGSFVGQTGAAGIIGHNGAKFYVTGVKLELGSSATPFAYDAPAVRLARCQRYYVANLSIVFYSYGITGDQYRGSLQFPVEMRALPTTTLSNFDYDNASGAAVDTTFVTGLFIVSTNSSGPGQTGTAVNNITCSAEI